MTSNVIIRFKLYPELGKVKAVADDGIAQPCKKCALWFKECFRVDENCGELHYHYEKVIDK